MTISRPITSKLALLAWLLTLGQFARGASAQPHADPLNSRLPPDTLAFVELDPSVLPPAKGDQKPGDLLEMGMQTMSTFGVMPRQAGAAADYLKVGSQLGSRHNCLAWLGADLQIDPQTAVLTCNSVEFVWLIDVHGQPSEMVDLLTAALGNCSTRQTARQSVKTAADKTHQYIEFYDTQWPAWAKLYWTQEGDVFVLAVGSGSMEHYLSARAKPGPSPWTKSLADADAQAPRHNLAGDILARCYIAPRTLRARFPEAMKKTVYADVARAVDGQNNDETVLTARVKGRAVNLDLLTQSAGASSYSPWTINLAEGASLAKLVPPEARYYIVFDMNWPRFYDRIVGLLDAVMGHGEVTKIGPADAGVRSAIAAFPKLYSVDLQRDIVAHLSPRVLVHDAPQHPLHLPLMVTVVAAAEPGHEVAVSAAMEKLVARGAETLERRAAAPTTSTAPPNDADPWAQWTQVRLRKDKTGVWFIQYVLAGPAWKWVDRRFIYSWGPMAVKENVRLLEQQHMDGDWFASR